MTSGIVFGALASLYVGLLIWSLRKRPANHRGEILDGKRPFLEVLRRSGMFERLQPLLQRPRIWLAVLEGGCTPERLLRWTAEAAALAYAALLAAWAIAAVAGNPGVGWVGTLIGICLPALRARDLNRKVESRRQNLIMELPVFLSRLLVLVSAGEHVRRALVRCLDGRPAAKHPLYDELFAALSAMERGESMSLAMEEFGRRCAIPEAKLFAAVLLMNARRGGEEFVPALRDLTRQMWEKRKAAARTLGEQASSRLAFPLAVIFLLIIVLVGAPAIFMM
ncbi:type II secretion protein F [Cohnella sp. CFH 77786]|uniref:type II secretion system F family protein n=1 Tax=Cohnella sp. CFH 77786 TaxID=2662265 RepID=UPI001C60CDCE|nr:type II secretion system F family protein [Cohnella sp. CFH 77786]MBW5447083.1 type II secretion protein F [Cohnella sp. CFH 77786]